MSKNSTSFQEYRQAHIEQRAILNYTAEDMWYAEMRGWLTAQGIEIPMHNTVSEFLQGEYPHSYDAAALVEQFNSQNNITTL